MAKAFKCDECGELVAGEPYSFCRTETIIGKSKYDRCNRITRVTISLVGTRDGDFTPELCKKCFLEITTKQLEAAVIDASL